MLSTKAYMSLSIRSALFILPITYIWVGLLSFVFLHEHIKPKQVVGGAIIVLGMILYNS